jgi:hypothetical protein
LGCGVVTLANENGEAIFGEDGKPIREGRRARSFNYSGKTILTIKDYEEKIRKQIRHVQTLKNKGKWTSKNGDKGTL